MKRVSAWLVAVLAVALPITLAPASPASAAKGERSLAAVLTSDGNTFDRNPHDFDLTTEAVLAVLKAKPESKVGLLTDGSVALTAFVPTDRAFRRLAHDLTGRRIHSERKLFAALVRELGVDTIEQVLLYHVVPGPAITRKQARKADGVALKTALGPNVRVNVLKRPVRVRLQDRDFNSPNAQIVKFDLNKGNQQIAHGISRVLRPADL